MEKLEVTKLAKAAKARLFGNSLSVVESIVIDSRQTCPGSMFVCVVGENNDGHSYVQQAYDNGCRVFLMSNAETASELLGKHEDASVILAADTQEAFRLMAEWYINFLGVKKIGITGSVGKTTTKALTAAVLSQKYNVVCSQKNYNTMLGLCMTSFLADLGTDIIVYEMGMDRPGEIDSYVSWVKPDTAIITIIGDSHLERLGSKENIAKAKFEITNYLNKDDVLIYNSDSAFMDLYTIGRLTKCNFTPVSVGTRSDAGVRISDIVDGGLTGISFNLSLKDEVINIKLPILGKHNASNAALAACCGVLYGVSSEQIVSALSNVAGTDRRLSFENVNGLLLLDDSYNANPASMCAAIDVLMGINASRHVAVLADMYELGEDELSGHIIVGQKAAESGVDLLIAIGRHSSTMGNAAKSQSEKITVVEFDKLENSIEKILSLISTGDAVLVKGSNATKVSSVAEMIRSLKNQESI